MGPRKQQQPRVRAEIKAVGSQLPRNLISVFRREHNNERNNNSCILCGLRAVCYRLELVSHYRQESLVRKPHYKWQRNKKVEWFCEHSNVLQISLVGNTIRKIIVSQPPATALLLVTVTFVLKNAGQRTYYAEG